MRRRPRPFSLSSTTAIGAIDAISIIIGLCFFGISPALGGLIIFIGAGIGEWIKKAYAEEYAKRHNPYRAYRDTLGKKQDEKTETKSKTE